MTHQMSGGTETQPMPSYWDYNQDERHYPSIPLADILRRPPSRSSRSTNVDSSEDSQATPKSFRERLGTGLAALAPEQTRERVSSMVETSRASLRSRFSSGGWEFFVLLFKELARNFLVAFSLGLFVHVYDRLLLDADLLDGDICFFGCVSAL